MATRIYKRDENGEVVEEMCEARMLNGLLAQGYVVDPVDLEKAEVQKVDKWAGYTNQDIRELAKEAGIEGYRNTRIETLKAALDAQE